MNTEMGCVVSVEIVLRTLAALLGWNLKAERAQLLMSSTEGWAQRSELNSRIQGQKETPNSTPCAEATLLPF